MLRKVGKVGKMEEEEKVGNASNGSKWLQMAQTGFKVFQGTVNNSKWP